MPVSGRLSQWWKRSTRQLDALASAAEFDPLQQHERRLAEIEGRLHALEQSGNSNPDGPARGSTQD